MRLSGIATLAKLQGDEIQLTTTSSIYLKTLSNAGALQITADRNIPMGIKNIIRKWAQYNKRPNIIGIHLTKTCGRNEFVCRDTIFYLKTKTKPSRQSGAIITAESLNKSIFARFGKYRNFLLNITKCPPSRNHIPIRNSHKRAYRRKKVLGARGKDAM